MKWVGILLLVCSLAAGALAAATAYHVPLDLPDDLYRNADGEQLTIKAPAGAVVFGPKERAAWQRGKGRLRSNRYDTLNYRALLRLQPSDLSQVRVEDNGLLVLRDLPVPLAGKGDRLTSDLLKRLREQSASDDMRVRRQFVVVQDLSRPDDFPGWLRRWPGKWFFVASVAGLLVGAVIIRRSGKRPTSGATAAAQEELPEAALLGIKAVLDELRQSELDREARLRQIRDRLDEVQKTHMAAFIEARPLLIDRLGLVGFANLMDSYAACERQIFRAWSAAADGYYDEAVACLEPAAELLEEARKKLQQSSTKF
jgi:hypothetical protein